MIKIKEGEHFIVTQWSPTIPNYECTKCAFATINMNDPYKGSMQAHWDSSAKHNHAWTKEPEQKEAN